MVLGIIIFKKEWKKKNFAFVKTSEPSTLEKRRNKTNELLKNEKRNKKILVLINHNCLPALEQTSLLLHTECTGQKLHNMYFKYWHWAIKYLETSFIKSKSSQVF